MSNNDTFQWTNELVVQCFEYIREDTAGVLTPVGVRKNVEYFKASHTQQEPERIEVKHFLISSINNPINYSAYWYSLGVSGAIEQEKFPAIKEAIEKVLNEPLPPKPQVLFTTEDGVEIFPGDTYWHIISDWTAQMENAVEAGREQYKNRTMQTFSTKEKADEWVLMNKPCLSVNDILALWPLSPEPKNAITDLAKFKQKQPTT